MNYVAPQGVESVAQFLWSQSRVQPLPHHRLDRLDQVGGVWLAESGEAGKREEFDMVLLTLPVPQFAGTYHPKIFTQDWGGLWIRLQRKMKTGSGFYCT